MEDNTDLLAYMRETLESEFNVFCASGGNEALEKLETIQRPDVIVSDIMMDGMDGHELFAAVSSNEHTRDIPFMYLSAKASRNDIIQGMRDGAIDYIAKPFTSEELAAKIRSIARFAQMKKKLFEIKKLASLGQFAADFSEEIRKPLKDLKKPLEYIQSVEMKKTDNPSPKLREAFTHVFSGIEQIEKTAENLKNLYEDKALRFVPIDVRQIIETIFVLFRRKAGDKIRLLLESPEEFIITTDQGALSRILMNLLSNGIDAIEDEGVVKIILEATSAYKKITVSDTGRGMTKEEQDSMFDIFYSRKPAGRGSGMGLTIVQDLAIRLNLSLSVNSQPGKGTQIVLQQAAGETC